MARNQGIKIENDFTGGLNTESTALKFPKNACTETFNCLFDERGRVTRRPSLDIEEGYTIYTATKDTSEVFTEFLWQAVSGSGTLSFLVVQQGATLHFYDVSNSVDAVSSNKKSFTVDLDTYLADSGTLNPASNNCSFASGRGDLLVANPACDPIYVSYNESDDTITVGEIVLKQRDFTGLDDGLGITERITSTVAALRTDNGEHYYNLLNQGWHQGKDNTTDSALHQWDTARTDIPSNADYVGLYRASFTDSFDNARVAGTTPGNRHAPKGHFILDVANPNRYQAIIDDGWAAGSFDSSTTVIDRTIGTIIHNFDNASAPVTRVWDGAYSFPAITSGTSGYIGKTYSPGQSVLSITCHPASTGLGFNWNGSGSVVTTGTVTIKLYAKTGAAPTSGTDGTLLGTVSFTNSASIGAKTISSSDSTTVWDHIWIYATVTTGEFCLAEVVTFQGILGVGDGGQAAYVRPGKTAFYSGRAWYAGLNSDGYNNSLFFSQIIERRDQYGLCYQVNDPTAEDFYDLLPSDGGVIKIPEMANVVKLHVYQKSLVVFATNGVWLIRGSSNNQFSATSYSVSKLPSIGTQSPLSFVDVKGLPLWWAEDGIHVLKYNPQFDSFSVESVTDNTIKTFFLSIPVYNRQFAKGAYDVQNQRVVWLYNSDADLQDTSTYNSALVMNAKSGSFSPWTWTNTTPTVKGVVYAVDSIGVSTPKVKLVTVANINDTTEKLFFSEFFSDHYSDWDTYATDFSTPTDESDFESYFITGYQLDGETQKYMQSNYLYVFMDYLDQSSIWVQGVYDFANSGNSGKWSTKQQGYNSGVSHRDVVVRRLKVRGKGLSIQFKYTSEPGKPFQVLGWSVNESGNQGI